MLDLSRSLTLLLALFLPLFAGCPDDEEGDESSNDSDASVAADTSTSGDTATGGDSSTSTDIGVQADLGPVPAAIEGDTGLFYRPGVECFAWDSEPRTGTDIWVSPGGSDSNEGTSSDSPLGTLAEALCDIAPGQTLHIMPGTYYETVIMGMFGDAAMPITITGEMDAAQRPVLDGARILTTGIAYTGDTAEDQAYNVIIENLEFRNYTDQGLYVALADTVVIRNCLFDGNGFHSINPDSDGEGFSLLATDLVNVIIADNEARNSGPSPELLAMGLLGTAIDTWNIRDAVIERNHAHHNIGAGLLVEEGVNVQVRDNEINNNVLESDYLDGGIWLDGGHDVSVTNNYIHDNAGVAIQVSDSEIQFPNASCHYTVTGNRIENNWWALYTYNMNQCPLPRSVYLVWEDNQTSGNSYPGDNPEYTEATDGEILCHLWPCGENEPCVEPENTPTDYRCE